MSQKLARAEAEYTAQRIVDDCGFTVLPICPFEIARRHDIEVKPKHSSKAGVSGFLMRLGDDFGIAYASHIENEGFIRFTVAHELGHYFLPSHPEALFSGGRILHESRSGFISHDPLERQADCFASALLMPVNLFREMVDCAGCGFSAVQKLANQFKTSITATAIRYTYFSDHAVAVIVSNGRQIDYCFMSDQIRDARGISWIKKGDRISARSATHAFNNDVSNVEKGRQREGIALLSDWFDGAPDSEFVEEVIGLGSYGKTLTILSTEETLVTDSEIDDD